MGLGREGGHGESRGRLGREPVGKEGWRGGRQEGREGGRPDLTCTR